MKRLLSLDGGGIRGVYTLCVLERIETLLRQKHDSPNYTLSDYFDYVGGTSTGAIIASCISWGMPVSDIKKLYIESGQMMFAKRGITGRHKSKFHSQGLTDMLKKTFSDANGPVDMGSEKLKTKLLIVARNATTGSAWPITNNPKAMFNQHGSPGNNLKIPLWQLIRASTAAPTFFPPEKVTIYGEGEQGNTGVDCVFEDGGVTPYNNPSYLLYLKATLPQYHLEWPSGEENIHLVSVGTGYSKLGRQSTKELNLLQAASSIPAALMQSYQQYQDMLCRVHGRCVFGSPLDMELGDMVVGEKAGASFTYARYNHTFTPEELQTDPVAAKAGLALDNVDLIPFLDAFGTRYAADNVQLKNIH